MKLPFALCCKVLVCVLPLMAGAAPIEDAFREPPLSTRPRCYWYWMDGHITKEGITRDLEAMKRVGIGEGYIGIISGQSGMAPNPEPKALTEPWWANIEHAIREGGRIGVDIGVFNSPGWSQSGGPWVKPEQAMRYVVLSETRLRGPQHFEGKLPAPAAAFQDVAVLAFPAPAGEGVVARVSGRTPTRVQLEMPEAFTARSVRVQPTKPLQVTAELQASDDGQAYRPVTRFAIDRHNLAPGVGPVALAPVVASFPATTAKFWRLEFSGACELGDIELSPAARIDGYAEKSLIKAFQDPLPPYGFYTWPKAAEPDATSGAVAPAAVRDLTKQLAGDGTLRWDVPDGEWIVVRAAMTPTGTKNGPAPAEATGLEVDKMNRTPLKAHFEAYIGELLRRLPASDRKAWKHVVADSYEQGPQNWTDGFATDFQKRYGYDPLPWMPSLSGRVVGSPEQSDRFLWDLRRLVADRVAHDYVGGLRDLSEQHGLKMWLENYGHWGFPAEFLQYGGASHEIGGEFWVSGALGSLELRAAASAAHTYGKPVVWAEAFTGGPPFRNTPADLKARGDWAFCEGINQFVLHVYIHQPWEDKKPGINAGFGTEFNRHNTWFEQGKAWIDYLRRCSVMLQSGQPVADVAYFITENTPKMTGLRDPELPPGRDFDFINAEVIAKDLRVRDGLLTLPDGVAYRVLVLPPSDTMRPELLVRIRELVKEGATVVGRAPSRSPSLENFPKCDEQVRQMASEVWGADSSTPTGEHSLGKGRVVWGKPLAEILASLGSKPDFECAAGLGFKHRQEGKTDVYFVANPAANDVTAEATFRVEGKLPELWWPDSGKIERPGVWDLVDGRVRIKLPLGPTGSVFVVFRDAVAGFDPARTVELPAPPAPPKVVIQKASYGVPQDPARTHDVRAKIQAQVDQGELTIAVGRLAEGDDPAFGTVKTLQVEYTIAGRAFQASGQDTQSITLGVAAHPARVTRNQQGGLVLEAAQPGVHKVTTASGKIVRADVQPLPAPMDIAAPWEVAFEPGWGAPDKVVFKNLDDWSTRPEDGIRHYSGRATYRNSFEMPTGLSAGGNWRLTLAMGKVCDLATVRVNGRELATLWLAPWEVDITAAVKPGRNTLEIVVANTWNNRLAGDAAVPADKRATFVSTQSVNPGAAVLPAGLLGPVSVHASRMVDLK